MTNAQIQDRRDCESAQCKFLPICAICWGRKCNRQGGRKIPRFRGRIYNGNAVPEFDDVVTLPRKLLLGGESRW